MSTATTGPQGAITMASLLKSMREVMDNLPPAPTPMRIISNPLCLRKTDEPKSKFERKPWMRESYHRRVQKKRIKRFGYVMEPAAYEVNTREFRGYICHPTIADKLRRLTQEGVRKSGGNYFGLYV